MGAAKLSTETVFLREFARFYVREISFTPEADADLAQCPGVGLADVLYVLKKGRVISGEKEDAEGAQWCVSGFTCNDQGLLLFLEVWCDRYRIRVLNVRVTGAKNG